jgi:hypothetical protein
MFDKYRTSPILMKKEKSVEINESPKLNSQIAITHPPVVQEDEVEIKKK